MHRILQHAQAVLRDRIFASIWIIPAVVLPILACSLAWFAYEEYEETIDEEYRFLEAHARIAEGQLAGLLRNIKQLLKRIADERPALPATRLAAYETMLAERNRDIPEVRTLAIVGADGRVELAADPKLKGFDGSKREYFTSHRDRVQEPNFHIARPYLSSYGDYSVGFSVAMRDDRQRLLGVVVAGVNYKYFESVMTQIKPEGPSSVAAIFNMDGDILYRLPDAEKHVGKNIADAQAFQAFKQADQPVAHRIGVTRIDGVERISVYRTIGNTSLAIAVARPLDEVLAAWRRNTILRALIFVGAAAVTIHLARVAHRRQNEVLKAKEFSEQLIATANVMVVGLDAAGRVVTFNEAAAQVSGYPREEMIGSDWFDSAMPRARYPQAYEAFRAYYAAGRVPRSLEVPILAKNGEERLIAWQNSTIREQGRIVATISFGIDVTERWQVEEARYKEEVSRRLVAAQEEERRRLAVELHDSTNPNLCAIKINCKLLKDSLAGPMSEEQEDLLADSSALLEDTIAAIRAISVDYRPPLLDYAGLWPALEGYASRFHRRTGIEVRLGKYELPGRLAPEIETNLFHIAKEALTNCALYSEASTIQIDIERSGDAIAFSIADDGAGFDPRAEPVQGRGLATMRQRAEFIGGKFSLDSAPGTGTRITVAFAAVAAAVATS